MLSLVRLRPDGADRTYYERAVASSREDYYAGRGEAHGEWSGSGARDLGLSGQLGDGDLTAILAGRHPATGDQLRRLPAAREVTRTTIDPHTGDLIPRTVVHRPVSGFDLVFAAPKSVSLLYALAAPEVQAEVAEAHRIAWRDALELLEDEATIVRIGPGGARRERSGLVAAAFQHRTSREGDPHLHTHVIVANMGRAPDGRMRALDGQPLICDWRQAAGYLYQSRLRHELTTRLGLEWGPVTKGQADLTLFPAEVLEAFATRRDQIVAHAVATGAHTPHGLAIAQRATRPDKHELDWDQAVRFWWARAAERGLREPDVLGLRTPAHTRTHHGQLDAHRAPANAPASGPPGHRPSGSDNASTDTLLGSADTRTPALPSGEATDPRLREALFSEDGLTATAQTFTRADIVKAVAAAHPHGATAHRVRELASALLDAPEVIPVGEAILGRAERLTTQEILGVERAGLAFAVRGRGVGGARTGAQLVDAAVKRRPVPLTDEQIQVARTVADHPDNVACVIGAAGAGKTTAIAAGIDALREAGIPVIGGAPSAQAAHTLAHAAPLPAHTLHGLLAEPDHLPSAGVLVIDEASMADTRTLAALLEAAEQRQTRTVLVGDTHQLPAVGPGGLFDALVEREGAVRLESNQRQREEWERAALRALRRGEVDAALRAYAEHGRVEVCAEPAEAIARCVDDWWEASDERRPQETLMLAYRRAEVEALNLAARQRMREAGLLGDDVRFGARAFAVGDRVMERKNDRSIGARNGRRGTILSIDAHGLLAILGDDGSRSVLPGSYARQDLAHAYAITVHASQGTTVRDAFLLATPGSDLAEVGYVALSRAKDATHIYIADPLQVTRDPTRPAPMERLADSLRRSSLEPLATVQIGELDREREEPPLTMPSEGREVDPWLGP